jgi:hypothetical protein
MSDGLPMMPKPFLEEAEADLETHEIAYAWRKYLAWHAKAMPGGDYRMVDWQREIEYTLRARKMKDLVKVEPAKAMTDEEIRKACEDEEYAKNAMTFSGWIAWLKANRPTLSKQDAAFLAFREAQELTSPLAWGLDCIGAFGDPQRDAGAKCECPRCRTVAAVESTGFVTRRHDRTTGETVR